METDGIAWTAGEAVGVCCQTDFCHHGVGACEMLDSCVNISQFVEEVRGSSYLPNCMRLYVPYVWLATPYATGLQ